jgi:uncharacterized protein YecE (DUF72 family)
VTARSTEGRSLVSVALYIGTSGWDYREWKPGFYPAGLPHRRFLEHYSSVLPACEVNATFYRIHSTDAVTRWAEAVPATFRFCVKVHRRLTHARNPLGVPGRRFLKEYLASIAPLEGKLGALLFQFPPTRARDDELLEAFLRVIPDDVPSAFEFRDASWMVPEVSARIAAAGGTVCLAETAGEVPGALPDGPFAYVRLRAERYGASERDHWLKLLAAGARERDVFAFAKHEGIPAGDELGGVGMAGWLVRRLDETAELPRS